MALTPSTISAIATTLWGLATQMKPLTSVVNDLGDAILGAEAVAAVDPKLSPMGNAIMKMVGTESASYANLTSKQIANPFNFHWDFPDGEDICDVYVIRRSAGSVVIAPPGV